MTSKRCVPPWNAATDWNSNKVTPSTGTGTCNAVRYGGRSVEISESVDFCVSYIRKHLSCFFQCSSFILDWILPRHHRRFIMKIEDLSAKDTIQDGGTAP